MSQPVVPTRLEFMDARSLELLRLNGADVPEAGAMLLVEADGDHDTLPYRCRPWPAPPKARA